MELEYVKCIAALILCSITFLFSMLPLLLTKILNRSENNRRNYSRVLSFLSCFGGGVFLGTCLLDLFPDVRNQMNNVYETYNFATNYPVAEFLLAFGFLAVLVTEQIVLDCKNSNEEESSLLSHQHSHQGEINAQQTLDYGTTNNERLRNDNVIHDHEKSLHQDQRSHSVLRSMLLVFALSLHAIFEGLAIGLQPSTQNMIRILLAVLIHKSIIAFTLGLNLTHSKLRKKDIIRCNSLFSITSPIGIVMGAVIVDLGKGHGIGIVSGVLQGLAAGTFLYVTFFEVLPHELNSDKDKMLKMMCLILGFSVISLLIIYM